MNQILATLFVVALLTSFACAADGAFTFYVISDTHLIEHKDGSYSVHPSTVKIVDEIIKNKPDFVLHCGDMIHANSRNSNIENGKKMWVEFFRGVKQPLEEKGIPLLVTPGNHDLYKGVETLYRPLWRKLPPIFKLISGEPGLWCLVEYKSCLFFVLDAHTVSLSADQKEWLAESIPLGKEKRAVFLAGHVGLYGQERHPNDRLSDEGGGKLIKSIPYEAWFFSGHQHKLASRSFGKVHNVTCGASSDRDVVRPTYLKVTVNDRKVELKVLHIRK